MAKPNSPIIDNRRLGVFGSTKKCVACGCKRSPRGWVFLGGGALRMDCSTTSGWSTNQMEAFLCLGFHGPPGEYEVYTRVDILRRAVGGQFDLIFCSIRCLRNFLNGAIARLRKQIRTESTFQKTRRRKARSIQKSSRRVEERRSDV